MGLARSHFSRSDSDSYANVDEYQLQAKKSHQRPSQLASFAVDLI
jgi:hypothetical protein